MTYEAPKATYTKLRNGQWGLRVTGAFEVGERADVTKRDGSTERRLIGPVIYRGDGYTVTAAGPRTLAGAIGQAITADRNNWK